MENKTPLHNEKFVSELQQSASALVEKLQNDNFDEATDLINNLIEARDHHIFNTVGQLTRGLHSAIVNFHVDADLDANPAEINSSEIRDASDRLEYVINLTQKAADKTLDKVEAVVPIATNLGEEASNIRADWKRLGRKQMSKDEFAELYSQVDGFLAKMEDGTKELNSGLQEIVLEQGYQDLTGQVLKKVIGLVSNVEMELVNLMRMAGQVEAVTGMAIDKDGMSNGEDLSKGAGPQIHADKLEDVVSSQDDVDDLLSSLGF